MGTRSNHGSFGEWLKKHCQLVTLKNIESVCSIFGHIATIGTTFGLSIVILVITAHLEKLDDELSQTQYKIDRTISELQDFSRTEAEGHNIWTTLGILEVMGKQKHPKFKQLYDELLVVKTGSVICLVLASGSEVDSAMEQRWKKMDFAQLEQEKLQRLELVPKYFIPLTVHADSVRASKQNWRGYLMFCAISAAVIQATGLVCLGISDVIGKAL